MKKSILVINGPNLNLLGSREPEVYGHLTLSDIESLCKAKASDNNVDIAFLQSNSEGEIINFIQQASAKHQGIIINPGGYSHTSIAIMDAIKSIALPVIEVHLSNISQREEFRRHSYISMAAKGVICGLGSIGYEIAVDAMVKIIN